MQGHENGEGNQSGLDTQKHTQMGSYNACTSDRTKSNMREEHSRLYNNYHVPEKHKVDLMVRAQNQDEYKLRTSKEDWFSCQLKTVESNIKSKKRGSRVLQCQKINMTDPGIRRNLMLECGL